MLPDKNELNDELIEQISGGNDYQEKIGQKEDATLFKGAVFHYICLTCGMTYFAAKQRTDGFCPNCESKRLEVSITTSNMKTTISDLSNKEKLFKLD